MVRGASKRRSGKPRRQPGTGLPVEERVVSDPDHLIPARIREQLGPDLAGALLEIARIAGLRRAADEGQARFVSWCRDAGLSWDSIGWFLGTTGRAVNMRYGEAVDDELDAAFEDDDDDWIEPS